MNIKDAKKFSTDAIYGISEMETLIKSQTQEIEDLKEKIEKCQIQNLSESSSPECPTEEIAFESKYDFIKYKTCKNGQNRIKLVK